MGSWSQLFFFLLFLFFGIIVALFLSSIVAIPFTKSVGLSNITTYVPFLKIAQVIQAICLFILPVLAFSNLFEVKSQSFLKTNVYPPYKTILFSILLTIVIQPFIQLISYYNDLMTLPESMSSIESWMREKENAAKSIVELFIADKSIGSYITNILIVAIVAGISEEFFFRGGLQQIINKIVTNKHVAIWITATIFSAIHFQFYGFIPRVLLGALLGYLFVWSGSIWIPILVHICHNTINIVIPQIYFGTPQYENIETMGIENHIWLAILSCVLSIGTIYALSKQVKPQTSN